MTELHKQEQDNTYIVEFLNYKAILINGKLADIVCTTSNHSIRDKNFTQEETRNMIDEMIKSRIASEEMIVELENKNNELTKENETLYYKWQEADNWIEKHREELEANVEL